MGACVSSCASAVICSTSREGDAVGAWAAATALKAITAATERERESRTRSRSMVVSCQQTISRLTLRARSPTLRPSFGPGAASTRPLPIVDLRLVDAVLVGVALAVDLQVAELFLGVRTHLL